MHISSYVSIITNNILTIWIFLLVTSAITLFVRMISAYIIYKDAKERGQSPTYWCIYDIFITSFNIVGVLSYYFFVVKPSEEQESQKNFSMPIILIMKIMYQLILLTITIMLLCDLAMAMFFSIHDIFIIIAFCITLSFTIWIPKIMLYIIKILAINKLHTDAIERIPNKYLTWSLVNIFFTQITTITYTLCVIKSKQKKVQPIGQLTFLDNDVDIDMDSKIPPIFIIYVVASLLVTFVNLSIFLILFSMLLI